MELLTQVDWARLFVPSTPILELIIRGTVMYLALFTILRVVLKRESGSLSVTDLLVVVLLADAAQNGMAGSYSSITEGLIVVLTIVFWSYALSWVGYHFSPVERAVYPEPLMLVRDGEIQWENMEKELVTWEELLSQLRHKGIDRLSEVKEVYLEGDGRVSVIKRDAEEEDVEDDSDVSAAV